MSRPVQIAVIGAGECDEALAALAHAVGHGLASAGARVVCGGLGGVMEAVARGAAEAGGEVIGIVPGTSTSDANPYVTHPVASAVGWARNLAVVASADAVIAIGGEWGTLSEIGHARQLAKPVMALESWTVSGRDRMRTPPGIEVAETPDAAVSAALSAARPA